MSKILIFLGIILSSQSYGHIDTQTTYAFPPDDSVSIIKNKIKSIFWDIPCNPDESLLQKILSVDSVFYSFKMSSEKEASTGEEIKRYHCYFEKWKAFTILPHTANQLDIIVNENKRQVLKKIQINYALNERGIAKKIYYWINQAFENCSPYKVASDNPLDSPEPAKTFFSTKYYSSFKATSDKVNKHREGYYLYISIMEFKKLQPSNWGKLEITIFDNNIY